jgi:hypothetical protein
MGNCQQDSFVTGFDQHKTLPVPHGNLRFNTQIGGPAVEELALLFVERIKKTCHQQRDHKHAE